MRLDLPSAIRNPISLIGIAVTTAAGVVFLVLLALELSGQIRNPYFGLLLFVAVPAVFVMGLVLMCSAVLCADGEKTGAATPDLAVKDEAGNDVKLSTFKGKSGVVVFFFPRADTPG